jgi:hypothetical protein
MGKDATKKEIMMSNFTIGTLGSIEAVSYNLLHTADLMATSSNKEAVLSLCN